MVKEDSMYEIEDGEKRQDNFYNRKNEYNITIQSQLRIQELLNLLVKLELSSPFDSPEKQKLHLVMVRQIVTSAIPHISPADYKKYKSEILNMQLPKKSSMKKGKQCFEYKFSPIVEKRLNEIVMELQDKLRNLYNKFRDEEDDGL